MRIGDDVLAAALRDWQLAGVWNLIHRRRRHGTKPILGRPQNSDSIKA